MRFRPCIDIHNGAVKQIVGGSLKDEDDQAVENYKAEQGAGYFAHLYRKDGLRGDTLFFSIRLPLNTMRRPGSRQ